MAKWREINDKSPKHGRKVLVCGGQWASDLAGPSDTDDVHLVYRGVGKWPECGGEYYASWVENPTHWQPCPEPHGD